MPVELGSFDAIIGMDLLTKYHAVIVCVKKIVRIPWGNEILIVRGNGNNQGYETCLYIISYAKTQEYMLKGFLVFLANVTTKETEDKSEKKQLEDVLIVRYFPDVFLEDLSGLPPTRQVEFQIDLIPGAAHVARTPYRLAPSEMKELPDQFSVLSRGVGFWLSLGKKFIGPPIHIQMWTRRSAARLAIRIPAIRLSPASGTGRRYPEDGIPKSIWSLRVPSDAIWFDERTSDIFGPYE
ncbi:hypothetical protein Tco_1024619 [Tanacetum coccineum]